MRMILTLLVLIAAQSATADNKIIGTVSFLLDGGEQTWYVLESPDGLRSNALWLDVGPNRSAISVTAFNDPDITLVPHDMMNSAVPDGSAPALAVSISYPTDASAHIHTLPVQATEGPAVIMLLNDWSNPINSSTLSDGPGEIRLTEISTNKESASRFAGTFAGELQDGESNVQVIKAGRFEFEEVVYFERP